MTEATSTKSSVMHSTRVNVMAIAPTIPQIKIVLRRQLPAETTSESVMWLSVIFCAFQDLRQKSYRNRAREFLLGKNCASICDYIGINHEFVVECLTKYQGAPV